MRLLSIPDLLVHVVLFQRCISFVIPQSLEHQKHSHNGQLTLNMGSAWSGVSTETKSQIVPPIEKVTADSTDPRYRRLIHLLRLNHHEHAIYYHGLKYHNHLAYILVSAYMFGASVDQLNDIYDKESKELEQWTDSPEEIDPDNWRAHFGAKEYQRAYLHFFEDETIRTNATVWSFLTDRCVPKDGPSYRDNQLLHGLVEGVGHPLIHLGYALEIEDKGLAMEALTMAATSYQNVHEFVDNPSPPQTFLRITDMREIFTRIYDDDTFDAICERYGCGHPDRVLEEAPPYMLFDSYEIQKETMSTTFQTQVEAATLMFIASHKENNPQYDFFLAHAVTAAHALRIVLPQLSFQQAWHVLRSHMVLSTMLYISQCRPNIKDDLVRNIDTTGKDWDYIRKQALEGEHRYDSHYVKVLRSFYEFEKLYGKGESDSDPKYDLYLKAAVKFADTFKGWTGFGTSNEPSLDTKMSNGSN